MDNRIRPEKSNNTVTRSNSFIRRITRSRYLWPAISMALTGALLICLIAVLSRTCDIPKSTKDEKQQQPEKPKPIGKSCIGFPWSEIRLPSTLTPIHYDLTVHPNISEQTFTGRVIVHFKADQSTSLIVLHAKTLVIDDDEVSLRNRRVKSWQLCDVKEQMAIYADRSYSTGEEDYLTISFKGNLSDHLRGLYRSSYKTKSGERKYVAVTQFEPTDARRMFPCWDEPAYKANFTVAIVRESNMKSISNMPLNSTTFDSKNGLYTDHFEKTLKMSTYLLAMAVSDFPSVDRQTANNVKVGVFFWESSLIEGLRILGRDKLISKLFWHSLQKT